jgi:hypothetical protein
MKNYELIEKLKALPEDLEILLWDSEWGYNPIDEIKVLTVAESYSKAKEEGFVVQFDVNGIDVGHKFIGLL